MSFLTGHSARIVREKSDKEIVAICIDKLRSMFPEEVRVLQVQYSLTRYVCNMFTHGNMFTYVVSALRQFLMGIVFNVSSGSMLLKEMCFP